MTPANQTYKDVIVTKLNIEKKTFAAEMNEMEVYWTSCMIGVIGKIWKEVFEW